jgi:LCP family protein required for cell wall assembly
MLVRIDPKAYRIALLSLPRDLWVSIPGYGTNRINTAYQAGELDRPGSGLQVARSTVSTLLDIPIDYVALTGFEGFIDLVDTLGGITVNVERELYDDQFPTMDYGYTVAHFLPGPQHMDGLTALTYSRTRHPDSDFMRIRRQQNTLISIGRRLRERGNLQSMQQMEQTSREIISLVRTDMPKEQVMSLVWTMRDFDTANVERYALGAEGVTFGVGNDRYALVPSRTALDSLTRQFLGGSP